MKVSAATRFFFLTYIFNFVTVLLKNLHTHLAEMGAATYQWTCNACTIKRIIILLCIPKQST